MNETIFMETATLHMVSSSHPFFCYSDSWTSSWSLLSGRVKDEFMLQTEWSLSIFKYLDKFDRYMDNKMQIINMICNSDWQKSGDFCRGSAPVWALLLGILELNMDIGLLSAPVMLLSLFFPRYWIPLVLRYVTFCWCHQCWQWQNTRTAHV